MGMKAMIGVRVDKTVSQQNPVFLFFFFKGYGDHRDLHRVDRRQRQMCIRDRSRMCCSTVFTALRTALAGSSEVRKSCWPAVVCMVCLLYTSPSPRDS